MNAMRVTRYSTLYKRDVQDIVAHDIEFTSHGTVRYDTMGRRVEIDVKNIKRIEQLEKSAWNE